MFFYSRIKTGIYFCFFLSILYFSSYNVKAQNVFNVCHNATWTYNIGPINTNNTYLWQSRQTGQSVWTNITQWDTVSTIQITNIIASTEIQCLCDTNGDNDSDTIVFSGIVIPYGIVTPPTISSSTSTYICYGTAPANIYFSNPPSGGDGSFLYQWQVQVNGTWTDIPGATGITFQPPALTINTTYRVCCFSTCGNVSSDSITFFVYPELTAGTIASSEQTICHSASTQLFFTTPANGGGTGYNYQWQQSTNGSSFSNIYAATSTTLNTGLLTQTTSYRVVVTSQQGCGSNTTNIVTVNVRPPFTACTINGNDSICHNTAPDTLSIAQNCSGGAEPYSYQWQLSTDNNSYTDINGETDIFYKPQNLTQSRYYRLKTTSSEGCGTQYSSPVYIHVWNALQSATINSNTTSPICYDSTPSNIHIITQATGGNGVFSYQWQQLNDTLWNDLLGENGLSFQPHQLTETTSYRVISTSTNNCGSIASSPITINVWPRIDAGQLSDGSVCYNSNTTISFTQTPSGGGNIYDYYWQQSNNNSLFSNITGNNNSTLNTGDLTDTMYYRAIVISQLGCSRDTTNTITISVHSPFVTGTITGNTDTICNNTVPDTLHLYTNCSGGALPYSYQWQSSADNNLFVDIANATNTFLLSEPLTESTYFRLRFTSAEGCGMLYSDTVKIHVLDALQPAVISSNSTTDICYDSIPGNIFATSFASGSRGLFTYQWQQRNSETWTNIPGETNNSYQPQNLTDTTYYRLMATDLNGCGQIASIPISINVWPKINAGILADATICYNSDTLIHFSIPPSGGGDSYSYEWQQSTDSINFTNLMGSLVNAFNTGNLTDTIYYRVIVNSLMGCSFDTSNIAFVHVRNPFTVGHIEGIDTICNGFSPNPLYITNGCNGGAEPYSYQWQQSTDNSNFTNIIGANNTVFQPSSLTQSTYYRLNFISAAGCGLLHSDTIRIHVYNALQPATITSQTTSNICYDSIPNSIYATAPATGGNEAFSYQWQQQSVNGWVNIPGATSTSYQPQNLTNNTNYQLVATSSIGCGEIASTPYTINVWPRINSGILSQGTICYNTDTTITFLTPPSGGGNLYNYQWQQSSDSIVFNTISDATYNSLYTGNLNDTTFYRAIVISNLGCSEDTTASIKINVRRPFTAGKINLYSDSACYGFHPTQNVSMVIPCSGGAQPYYYKWMVGNDSANLNLLQNNNSTTLNPGNIYETTYYQLIFTSSANCGTLPSNIHTIKMNPLPPHHQIDGETEVCYSQYETYTLPTATDAYSYTWSCDGNNGMITSLSPLNDSVEIFWNNPNYTDSIVVSATDNITGCISYHRKGVTTGSETAPERTTVIRKPRSNILICKEDNPSLYYRWGFTDKTTSQEEIIENSNRRYVLLPHDIDTITYYYWVELLPSEYSKCYSRSIYDPANDTQIEQPESAKVSMPSLFHTELPIKIENVNNNNVSCEVFTINGVLIHNAYLGTEKNIEHSVFNLQSGSSYIVRIIIGDEVFTQKTISL